MIVIAKLEKPYNEYDKLEFIVAYNHNLGYDIKETETELQALCLDEEEQAEAKKNEMRNLRNSYLVKYVDPKQLVLVWDSLDENNKEDYKNYRQYLLDYPSMENWWKSPPLDFDTWKKYYLINNQEE